MVPVRDGMDWVYHTQHSTELQDWTFVFTRIVCMFVINFCRATLPGERSLPDGSLIDANTMKIF
jgi:hypothetical protein